MPAAPNVKSKKAFQLYKDGTKLIEIARLLDVPEGTVRRWKCTQKWDGERSVKVANVRREIEKKRGGQPGNKNGVGHGGKPKNKNAVKHGLFIKWLPEETAEIIGTIAEENPLDLLWNNILLQQAAIIRAQQIMLVKDQQDKTKELKKEKEMDTATGGGWEKEYEIQFAWDKQAAFLTAQSRAYATYMTMVKQYDEMLHAHWDLATEEQKARIAALKKQAGPSTSVEKEETGIILMPPVLPAPADKDGEPDV